MFKLLDVLFGCTHDHLTFPITAKAGQRRSDAAAMTGTYVVCLDCGKEFAYDWAQMKVISSPADVAEAITGSAPASTRAA
jgi:hypothetical protein